MFMMKQFIFCCLPNKCLFHARGLFSLTSKCDVIFSIYYQKICQSVQSRRQRKEVKCAQAQAHTVHLQYKVTKH